MLSYSKPSVKPLLFKSFTGLSGIQQFDDIFKIIESKYPKHEINDYLPQKENEKWVPVDISGLLLIIEISWFR
ncbi:MAG: hypothetical protein P0116_12025 [Candidatus Nitrosocosmicus sp.]|nr:hypothetical protein [Candidatus Nitrosocosmicus sp.]